MSDVTKQHVIRYKLQMTWSTEMSTTVRIRDEEEEMLQELTLNMMIETKSRIKESDVLHTLIRKHLKDIKTSDVMKYREEVLKKD
mgnify:FL=1